MIFTFALQRNPCRLVGGMSSPYEHFCGGRCELHGLPQDSRFVHIVSLDLRDPSLAFLGMEGVSVLPLVMDTAAGTIAYSVSEERGISLHGKVRDGGEPLMQGALPKQPMAVVPFTYEQYRAAALASAVIDESFLNAADRAELAVLGEEYSQIGGAHQFGQGASPYCRNPDCLGFPDHSMQLLVSIQSQLAPGVSLGDFPNDPKLLFFICGQCKSLAGQVAL